MESLWQILKGIPWWVFLLFIVLVKTALRSIKPQTIPLQKLCIIPLVFLTWSVLKLYQNHALEFPSLIFWWVLSFSVGAYLGFKEVSSWKIHLNKEKKTITIPGNYSTIVLVLAIFILNFFWGYFYSTLVNIPYKILLMDTISTTLCTGFFVGRSGLFFKRYFGF